MRRCSPSSSSRRLTACVSWARTSASKKSTRQRSRCLASIGRELPAVLHIVWPRRVADQIASRFRHTLKTGEPYRSTDFSARRRDIGVQEDYEWQIQRVTLPGGEYAVVAFFNNI